MGWAWLEVTSVTLSLTSLVVTGLWYNKEPGPGCRVFSALLLILTAAIFRVFVLSVIVVVSPLIAIGVIAAMYLVTVIQMACTRDGIHSLLHAYFSIYLPIGHNINSNPGPLKAERSKINHNDILRRVEIFLICHTITSLLLLTPYYTFLELVMNHPTESPDIILEVFHLRHFTHPIPVTMVILLLLATVLYYVQARKARAIAKTWSGISTSSGRRDTADTSERVESPITVRSPLRPHHNTTYSSSRPVSPALSMSRPGSPDSSLQRPCSMMYPYLPSAPSHNDTVDRESFPGGRKCEDDTCVTCVWLREGPNFHSSATRKKYKFMTPATCTDTCLVYLVTCRKCRSLFILKSL